MNARWGGRKGGVSKPKPSKAKPSLHLPEHRGAAVALGGAEVRASQPPAVPRTSPHRRNRRRNTPSRRECLTGVVVCVTVLDGSCALLVLAWSSLSLHMHQQGTRQIDEDPTRVG